MKLLKLVAFLCFCHIASGERWSRQLSLNVPLNNDWVPIAHDKKTGKSITFGNDLTPAAQTQFQFFTEPLNNRFNLQQSHPAHPAHSAIPPSEVNSFIQNSSPQFQFLNSPQKQRTVQTFGGPISNNKPIAEPLIQNSPSPPFQFMQEVQRTPQVHHYQSQPIPKSISSFTQHPAVPAFQSIQQPSQSRLPHFQKLPTPPPFQQQISQNQQVQAESEQPVQLLYVPFDSLYAQNQPQQQQPQTQTTIFGNEKQNRFNILNQPVSASLINDFYSQNEVQEVPQPRTATKSPTILPATSSYRLTTPFETVTTPKLKPHQPPLAMFVANDEKKGKLSEADVLNTLKNSNTIDVMDSVDSNAPKVFIGPSGMEAPVGYSKFELPYLSSIDGTRNERKVDQLPFFVAPLSYKTPPGFSKIPLPAPHVGSIVVNQPPNSIENNESKGFTPDNYYTKQPQLISSSLSNTRTTLNNNFNKLNDNDLSEKKNTQTVKLTSGFHLGSNGNVQLFSNEFAFPTIPTTTLQPRLINTTPRSTFIQSSVTPVTPLTKVKASVVQEHYSTLSPVTISAGPTKNNILYDFRNTQSDLFQSARSTQRLPVTTQQPSFTELNEHKTLNEEYFKVNRGKPSISSAFEYDFESKQQPQQKPKKDFSFKPIPEFNFDPIITTTTTRKPKTKATTSTTTIVTQSPSSSSTVRNFFENHKSIADYSFPSSTPVSPYTQSFEYTPTVSIIENTDTFKQIQTQGGDFFNEYRSTPRPTSQNYVVDIDDEINNNKNRQNGEGINTHDFFQQEHITATDSPNYNLPSELPQISAQLPGLINSLMDDKWMQKNNITDSDETTSTIVQTTSTTTRRPNTRGRRPVSTSTATQRQSTVEPNYSERKPVTRTRQRPSTYSSRSAIASTEATFPSRSTPTRSSKIRYNITSEDQSKFKTRNRRPVQKKEEENIEYQRDVLNQNYPSSIRPPIATESVPVENEAIEIQPVAIDQHINDYNTPVESVEVIPLGGNVYNPNIIEPQYTPDNPLYYENTIDTTSTTSTTSTTTEKSTTFSSLPSSTQNLHRNHKYSNDQQESTLLPQHKIVSHRLKGNFNFNRNIDSFYNTKSQDTSAITATDILPQDDNQEIFAASSTTTEAPEASVTRRTNFPRRRLYTTTTESTIETESTEPSFVSRTSSRGRNNNVVVVKKIRSRTRTTEAPVETTRRSTPSARSRASYSHSNRNVNRERSQVRDENNNEENKPRFRIRENTSSRFRLDTQESQWSTRLNHNSFQPIDEEKSKSIHSQEINDEQEIVTAVPENENDTYLVNVSASVVPTKKSIETTDETIISTTERDDDLIKKEQDVTDDEEKDSKNEKKATKIEKKGGRRGVWRKIKVRPADGFETAETQNIGKHLYNSVTDNEKKEGEKRPSEEIVTTTTIFSKINDAETTNKPTEITTTILPEPTVEDSKTRMFDDARKAFFEFLSSEDDSDDAVNMEEADDKLERESTTTSIPITEETIISTTTSLPLTMTTQVEVETATPRVTKEKKQVKTSTSQKISGEICFRGRCIKTSEK
ncbi:hypothetical protein PVAND_008934 [Polypedilum vanderplanki]|uniref:Uncharacterized protein n=1 Tax=Polypedilum vanderplanki TaxID=319348 RepID=A0A9J6CB58_POLVA|nr:hypothetical protein PVAND_008934 [Polypedilum vanderplanki]